MPSPSVKRRRNLKRAAAERREEVNEILKSDFTFVPEVAEVEEELPIELPVLNVEARDIEIDVVVPKTEKKTKKVTGVVKEVKNALKEMPKPAKRAPRRKPTPRKKVTK